MFEIGREYKRKTQLHEFYGGQRQGGISTPKNSSNIFIFISEQGKKYGYYDGYRDDGLFWYTGEGQSGDMKMDKGNKAIRDHSINDKTIHVFEYTKKAYVRYIGFAEYLGHNFETRPDKMGKLREAIVFQLDINSSLIGNDINELPVVYECGKAPNLKGKNLSQLRIQALSFVSKDSKVEIKKEVARNRSEALKLYILRRSKGICEGCNREAPFISKKGPFLECHHMHRLSDGGPDHPQNVIALCPNCHRRAHYSRDAKKYNNQLISIVFNIENNT